VAAAMMADPEKQAGPSYDTESLAQEVSPMQFVSRVLEAWDKRELVDDQAVPRDSATTIFTPREAHFLGCLASSYSPDTAMGYYQAMNLAGFAAMPRLLAADRYLQQKSLLVASLEKQGLSPDDENTLVGGFAITPSELIAGIPWSMEFVPDVFSFSEKTIGECARLLMGQVEASHATYKTLNKDGETIQRNFQPVILRSALFRSLIQNSLQENLESEAAVVAACAPVSRIDQTPTFFGRSRVTVPESVEPYIPAVTKTLLADMIANNEGELPILRGADVDKEHASAVLDAYIQICAAQVLTRDDRPTRGVVQPAIWGSDERKFRYLGDLPSSARVKDMHMVLEPFTASHTTQFPSVRLSGQSLVLSVLLRAQTAERPLTAARSYALYTVQRGKGPVRLQVKQSVTQLSQKSVHERFEGFFAGQLGLA